ncbi:hypothetical protein HYPSUDRAFT_206522 [Hypholoma sublateritium FD-334 SS-4]|uniref:Uncharacterized protein n=1 Tax=Hypholoma sublateritium (strain FD-334 SS-4) TaxID=945553 RepID=A0A0D2KR03_HYPSF|nr:hypothetical protein HYPSUDRAFT_206522 [Hypholoma sublateritium FD-334 SS-4]
MTTINELLPEIYPIIAAHLPLYATPSTLLALALTSHHISQFALPLLYSRLVLQNETDAILVLQKLLDHPPLGRIVRELHILSDLSVDTRSQDPPRDVIRRVEDLVSKGHLPFIHTLGLHLMERWYYDADKDFEPVRGFGQLRPEFLTQLKEKCPRLRGLVLKGFSDKQDEPWLEKSGFLQVPDITSLTLRFVGSTLQQSGSDKLLAHISSLASSLHTLDLMPSSSDFASPLPVFELDLPFLRSLSLASFTEVDAVQATAFFERHPSIEYLNLASNLVGTNDRWFASDLPSEFLPNLRHLRAHWNDVRLLAPILDRLHSLSINNSVNAQIPYLLRSVLSNGLPNLKSLDIGQAASSSNKNKNIEGSLWYESQNGTFHTAKSKKESRTVFDNFMHSIVRGAPNVEELGFHGALFQLSEFVAVSDDLNGFPRLKHLYYEEYYASLGALTEEERNTFASQAQDLAQAVPGLVSITNVDTTNLPYLTARISRRENGEVAGTVVGKGYGMKIGYDDEAFPWAPHNI